MKHHHIGQMRLQHQRFIKPLEAVVKIRIIGMIGILTIDTSVDRLFQMPTDDQRAGIFFDDLHVVVNLHPLRSLLHIIGQIDHDLARFWTQR